MTEPRRSPAARAFVRATPVADPPVDDVALGRRTVVAGVGVVVFLTLAHTVTDAMTNTLSALLPSLEASFGLTRTGLATLVATLWFSTSVTQPLFGALADRFGSWRVAGAGMVATRGWR